MATLRDSRTVTGSESQPCTCQKWPCGQSHIISVHVTQPHTVVLEQSPSVPYLALHVPPSQRNTQSLQANPRVTGISKGPHTITDLWGETHSISHLETPAHNFYFARHKHMVMKKQNSEMQ